VNYLISIAFAYIDNNQGLFMDLANGHFIKIISGFDSANDNNLELCTGYKSWQFKKYR
jgi:hypothetical protein